MSHDADKLIRQLSLVAFLMAERRPLTARDVKGERRGLLGDVGRGVRAPLLLRPRRADRARRPAPLAARRVHGRGALHPPLRALLPRPARARRRRARGAPDRALHPRGQVRLRRAAAARAPEPRARTPGLPARADRHRRARPRHARPTTRPSSPPGSRSSRRRSRSSARSSFATGRRSATSETERTAEPVRAAARRGRLVRRRPRPRPRRDRGRSASPGSASDIRFATRRERDFRLPEEFDVEAHRDRAAVADRRRRRHGADRGAGRHRLVGASHARRRRDRRGRRLRDDATRRSARSSRWILRQNGRAIPLEPPELRDEVADAPRAPSRRVTPAPRPSRRASAASSARPAVERQPAGPVAPERFGVLQALLAHLLAACGDEQRADARRRRARRALLDPARGAAGARSRCSTSSTSAAAATRCTRRSTRRPAASASTRSSTATSSASRRSSRRSRRARSGSRSSTSAPTIAADAHTPLERVRRKLEETFGQFELAPTPATPRRRRRGGAREDALAGRREAPSRRARVPQGGRGGADDAARRAVHDRARAPVLARAHLGPHRRRPADVPARPDALRAAHERPVRAATRASTRTTSRSRPSRGSGTRPRSPAGSSSAAPGS